MSSQTITETYTSPISLPFTELPIDIKLFQTEIVFIFLTIAFLFGITGYLWIRRLELLEVQKVCGNVDEQPKPKNKFLNPKNTEELAEEIITLISSPQWLIDSNAEKWQEQLITFLEIVYGTKLPRNGDYTNTTIQFENDWIEVLKNIEYIRYNPKRTEENVIYVQNKLQSMLRNKIVGNSSTQ